MAFVFAPGPMPVLPIDGEPNLYFPIRRIYGIAKNYTSTKMAPEERPAPLIFCKPADAVVYAPADKTLELDFPCATKELVHELELVAAIGKGGRNIPVEEAMDHVWGYCAGLDLTRRDLRLKDQPWEAAKAFDESAPMTALKPVSRVPDNEPMTLWLYVNNEKRQEGNTSQMIYTIAEIISHLSSLYELKPGDLIMTGTPAGNTTFNPGDMLEGGVQGVGVLKVKFSEKIK